jgi:hypothetical protein
VFIILHLHYRAFESLALVTRDVSPKAAAG